MNNEQACINFLTDYYYKNNGRTELINKPEVNDDDISDCLEEFYINKAIEV